MSNSDQEVRELYRKHVPEVACGVVEVVAVAREVGQYTMVAVRSHDSCIDPLSACVGKGAGLSKAIMRELGGGIRVVLWSESVREFIERTMLCRKRGPLRSPKRSEEHTSELQSHS